MKNLVSIFAGHDANVSFYDAKNDKYYLIEIERLVKKRYFRLHADNSPDYQLDILRQCRDIAEKEWGIENDYECALVGSDGYLEITQPLTDVFNCEKAGTVASHHQTHVASAFYQSPFEKALVVSYDGGGDDGFFNVYYIDYNELTFLKRVKCDFGGAYLLCGSLLEEVASTSKKQLAISGKLMGLCAYGNPIMEYVPAFKQFFVDKDYRKLSESIGIEFKNIDDPWGNPSDNYIFSGQQAYDIAATSQYAFEECFFDILNPILDEYDEELPLVMTGGCALNVLVNQKYKDTYDREVYVCPCPNDSGLSLGHMLLYQKPKKRVDVTYSGLPLLDRDQLDQYIQCYDAKKITKAESAKLLKDGNIIGFVYGNSEVGPRALGNRSIVCDPNIREMKDILNAKVKFREWYRPFAPFCKKEDASKYFESKDFENMEYMSYAPRVKEEYVKTLPSITHADNTARLQTVTEDSHEHFYDLLTEFGKISETNVLLNTSFNIRGYPILSTIEDALYALNNTEMDYVVIEDYLFGKAK